MKITRLLILLFIPVFVMAQDTKEIETDRPDQTESPYTVPHKWAQIEFGLIKEHQEKEVNSWTLPAILWKYGISKKAELRLITEYNTFRYGKKFIDTTGLQPLQLGFKINLFEENGLRPKTSLIAHTGFNRLGSKFFNPLSLFAPNFRFTMQNSLSENISLGYNLGAEWEDTKSLPVWIYTLVTGFSLNDKWYSYIEAFGFIENRESSQHNIDAGLAYSINNDCKLDISGGAGISKESPAWYVSIGGSIRFAFLKKKSQENK